MLDIDIVIIIILPTLLIGLVYSLAFGTFNQGYATAVCEGKNATVDWGETKGINIIVCVPENSCEKYDGTEHKVCVTKANGE